MHSAWGVGHIFLSDPLELLLESHLEEARVVERVVSLEDLVDLAGRHHLHGDCAGATDLRAGLLQRGKLVELLLACLAVLEPESHPHVAVGVRLEEHLEDLESFLKTGSARELGVADLEAKRVRRRLLTGGSSGRSRYGRGDRGQQRSASQRSSECRSGA